MQNVFTMTIKINNSFISSVMLIVILASCGGVPNTSNSNSNLNSSKDALALSNFNSRREIALKAISKGEQPIIPAELNIIQILICILRLYHIITQLFVIYLSGHHGCP